VEQTYEVTGRVRNAVNPTQGVGYATLTLAGQTVTTDASGFYSIRVAAGQHSFSLTATGYIDVPAGTVTITTHGTFDMNMSPTLSADSWRIVLDWSDAPRDLDSHLVFYNDEWFCPEMYYGNTRETCAGVSASLDWDEVWGHGPETTTLSGVNSCWWGRPCKWVYKVKNFSGWWGYDTQNGWVRSQARVTLYNGDRLVREFEVNSGHGYQAGDGVGGNWAAQESFYRWSVFSIDSNGNVEECSNSNCD